LKEFINYDNELEKNHLNFSFQFQNQKNEYLDYEIFIISDIEDKKIYLNFINSKENLSSDIFKNV
jgi:hypothetical protein